MNRSILEWTKPILPYFEVFRRLIVTFKQKASITKNILHEEVVIIFWVYCDLKAMISFFYEKVIRCKGACQKFDTYFQVCKEKFSPENNSQGPMVHLWEKKNVTCFVGKTRLKVLSEKAFWVSRRGPNQECYKTNSLQMYFFSFKWMRVNMKQVDL